MKTSFKQNLTPLLIFIAIPLAAGAFSALISMPSSPSVIYASLEKPPLSPPALLFPIVWTILYVLMGVSSGMVFIKREESPEIAKQAFYYYALSLVANFLWSIIFFNLGAFLFALVCLIALLYFIIRTIVAYKGVSPIAAYLQIPYALWVAFAGYLNCGIFLLNM